MHEPSVLLRWGMFHFAGGDALLLALIVLFGITLVEQRQGYRRGWTLLATVVIIWGGLSSPAWPLAILAPLFALILAWRIVMRRCDRHSWPVGIVQWSLRLALIGIILGELWATRRVAPAAAFSQICVIGDSVTAGLDRGEITWPRRFAAQTGLSVRDASRGGDTLKAALQQADWWDDRDSPLVLEIGGNDLLSGLPLDEFRRDCEALCQKVCAPGRVVWMFELPLPPLCSRYGAEQGRICRRHGVRLVSKRKFMGVLTTAGATVDGIHLTDRGQGLFCDLLRLEIGRPTSDGRSGAYVKCVRPASD